MFLTRKATFDNPNATQTCDCGESFGTVRANFLVEINSLRR